MRLLSILYVTTMAQSPPPFVRFLPDTIGIAPHLRSTSPDLIRRFEISGNAHDVPKGPAFFRRILFDFSKAEYFGYEFLVRRQPSGDFLASFGPLGVTPFELAANMVPGAPRQDYTDWSLRALPSLPEPRVVHTGDTLSIELFSDAAGKLTDELTIDYHGPATVAKAIRMTALAPPTPTVSGTAREFTAGDAEMQLIQARVTINGEADTNPSIRLVRGVLPWVYLPGRGRYVLSLAAHAGLDFKKAGEVRGGALEFAVDGDTIRLECPIAIAPGYSAYFLYVLHDRQWQPASNNQRDHPIGGTVGLGELTALQAK